jgi:hypothetical protein
MKATLEFVFPEDEQAHEYALNGENLAHAVRHSLNRLRALRDSTDNEIKMQTAETAIEIILDELSAYNINTIE